MPPEAKPTFVLTVPTVDLNFDLASLRVDIEQVAPGSWNERNFEDRVARFARRVHQKAIYEFKNNFNAEIKSSIDLGFASIVIRTRPCRASDLPAVSDFSRLLRTLAHLIMGQAR